MALDAGNRNVRIGLEIHGYLLTKEKLFCRCKAEHSLKESAPNTNVCPICTAQPGAKPMLPNKEAIDKVLQAALILRCNINKRLAWQRKHYDWPDLPKGYQNTLSGTYAFPVGENGRFFDIDISECHLEEDPAAWNPKTGEINYNKSGIPLIEIVTEPDFKSSEQVIEWLKQLITTLAYIKVIDKKLGIKADVNVSVGNGARVEIKNINSLKNIKDAIEYEIQRQKKHSEAPVRQETRMFDEFRRITVRMREKEHAEDYRFISDPDLPLIKIDDKRIEFIKSHLPETPFEKLKALLDKHKIDRKSAEIITKRLEFVDFFEKVIEKINPKLASRWITVELLGVLNYNKKELDDPEIDIKPEHFIELLELVEKKELTELKAKEILRKFIPCSFSPKKEVEKYKKISDKEEIEKLVDIAIKNNPKAVADFKAGKKESLNFLIGQVMRASDKRADFKIVKEIFEEKLED